MCSVFFSKSKKDAALKRYKAIELMRRAGENPAEYMLDRIPVLPPEYRPVTSFNGTTMVADSNYLYAQMLDARNDMRDAKDLPDEYQAAARANIYKKWKELTGLYDPESPKLKSKNVKGLLAWAIGGSGTSPKFSGFQRKILGMSVDTVGRGAVVPDPRVRLNEVGMPKEMAFRVFAPFVERELVRGGYTPLDAMKLTKTEDPKALDILQKVMQTHPVQMNRAPTLHKLSIMGFKPVLIPGHAIHVNPSIVVPFNMDFDGDTANLHVPVSDQARKETIARMFPERNLVAMRDRKIAYKPEKEYIQGLYVATRMKKDSNGRTRIFDSLDAAKQAQRDGIIDVDDPIIIRGK